MDLVIKDVPDVDSVKVEIITNAMATIENHLRRRVEKSPAEVAIDATVKAIKENNVFMPAVACCK